jgi:hypothetical protein
LICCSLLFLGAPQATAGGPPSPYEGDAVVATVTKVSSPVATFADPPHVTLEIQEVLQGEPSADRRNAIWTPPPHDVDTGTITDNPRYKAWAARRRTARRLSMDPLRPVLAHRDWGDARILHRQRSRHSIFR